MNSPEVTDRVNGLAGEAALEALDADGMIAQLDEGGVERALVLSTAYMMAMDAMPGGLESAEERAAVARENDYAAIQCARHPERLIPFCSVNPKRPWAREEIDRAVDEGGHRGVKLHFWNSVVDLRDEGTLSDLAPLFGHLAERDLPVVVHVFNGAMNAFGPDDVERFVRRVVEPAEGLRISFAHVGGAGGASPWVLSIFRRLTELAPPDSELGSRTWVDIAAVLFSQPFKSLPPSNEATRTATGDILRAWGPSRTFWGSDTVPGYVTQTARTWPLGDDAWNVVTAQDGRGFLSP